MRALSKISCLIAWAAVGVTATGDPQYQIYDIGVVQTGDTASQGFGVSPGGIAVGRSFQSSGTQAFTWTVGGGLVGLPNLASRNYCRSDSANDSGTVVGTGSTTAFGSARLPLVWQNGLVSQLPLPGGQTLGDANHVNALGVAVGSVDGGSSQRGVIYSGGSASIITQTTANGSFFVTAFGINDFGRIVGFGIDPNNAARNVGIVYDMGNATAFEVGALLGFNGALAFAVSNNGHVVGSSMLNQGSGLPFIYSDAVGIIAIPLASGTSQGSARGVNSAGWVVGQDSSAFSIPFLYDGSTTYRLADLLPAGSGWDLSMNTSSSALGISESGVIVGTGVHNGETHAYAMVPVTSTPAPSPTVTPPPTPTLTPSPTSTPTPTPTLTPTPTDFGGSPTPSPTATATASPTPTATASPAPFDGFDPNSNGTIYAVLVQPDGKILLGGMFTTLSPNGGATVTRNNIARLNPDGSLDTAFNPNADFPVNTFAVQADGKILVGGQFTSIGGQMRHKIARLDPLTGLADSFDPNPDNVVKSIVVQADGKILVGGFFDSIGGQIRHHIARLDATTGLADSFDPNVNNYVHTLAVQMDGKILVGGGFTGVGGQTRNSIARLDPTTGLVDSFDPNSNSIVDAIALQADGKILAAGYFTTIGGQTRRYIARLDATTGLADSFDPNANVYVNTIAVQADGKILTGGRFSSIGGQFRNRIARLDPTTGLADSFNPSAGGGNSDAPVKVALTAGAAPAATPETPPTPTATPAPLPDVLAIAVQADGKVLAGGGFTTLAPNGGAPVTRNRIARLEIDGRLDQTLRADVSSFASSVYATAVQPDGKILLGGEFTTVLGVTRNNMARLNTDGTLDMAFNPNANSVVLSIAVQVDGKILVGGTFDNIGGQTRNSIARLDATTGSADSFDPSSDGVVYAIAVQADGKILAVGLFDSIGAQTRHNIARLDPSTGFADSFDPNANNIVNTIAVQADGKVLAGGQFTNIGGSARNRIARLDAVTGLADSFNPNSDRIVSTIAVQTDGKILVSGDFFSIGGQLRTHVARLDPTTGLPDSFDPSPDFFGGVTSFALQANGQVVVGGSFTTIGGQLRGRLARLDATTGLADSFNPIANDIVFSVAAQADGKILAGGYFTTMGGQPRSHFARLSNDTAALQDLSATQTAITWTRGGSSPQLTRVTFEYSANNVIYTFLGSGTASGSNWILTGFNLPTGQNFYIRARGYYRSGDYNGSESIAESVRNAFIAGPPGTPPPTPTATATATATATPTASPPPTPTPTLTPSPTPAAQAVNLSTRMRVQTGDNVGIGGFIITGTAPRHLLFRGIGPSLIASGITDVLANPTLDLRNSAGVRILANNDWRDTQEAEILATGIPPTNNLEAAIVETLDPGSYTVILRGMGMTSGVGLVEIYDLDQGVDSKLANLSTRAFVSTGDNIVIAGFILGGNNGNDRIVVRGIGPSLTAFGVPDPLANPTLELRDNNGAVVLANNDWQDNPAQAAEIIAAGLAPTNQLESGIAAILPPGPYTALLAGMNNGIGNGVVEVYDRGAP